MSVTRVNAIPLSVIDAATIDVVTPTAVNPNGLPHSCYLLRIINSSNTPIAVLYGSSALTQDYIPANSHIQIFGQANANNAVVGNFPKGLIVSVIGLAGVGSIYVGGYYLSPGV